MDTSQNKGPQQGNNTLAILSLVFSFLCAPVGLILGIIALVKKQSKGLAITGVVISSLGTLMLFSLIGGISKTANDLSSNSNSSSSSSSSSSNSTSSKTTAKVGEPVRDGKFEFTVLSSQCGINEVGSEYLNKTAQGQYCKVSVKVKNVGDKPQSMSSSSQKLYSADNKQFSTDDTAMIYASSGSQNIWLNEINPGNEVTGDLIFDIPRDSTPAKIELFDSAFSGGAMVSLQ